MEFCFVLRARLGLTLDNVVTIFTAFDVRCRIDDIPNPHHRFLGGVEWSCPLWRLYGATLRGPEGYSFGGYYQQHDQY